MNLNILTLELHPLRTSQNTPRFTKQSKNNVVLSQSTVLNTWQHSSFPKFPIASFAPESQGASRRKLHVVRKLQKPWFFGVMIHSSDNLLSAHSFCSSVSPSWLVTSCTMPQEIKKWISARKTSKKDDKKCHC